MKETLLVVGIVVMGLALRSSRNKIPRRVGVLYYMAATGLVAYFLTGFIVAGILAVSAWFLFPWLELLLSVRKTRLPLENKLRRQSLSCENYFPEASDMKQSLKRKGYTHLTDCGWKWAKSHEHYSFFWNEEKKHLVSICHRIQTCVTFCYLNISSRTEDGRVWRSSNFPFSAALPPAPQTQFNHVVKGNTSCPEYVIYAHELFLYNAGIEEEQLIVTDTDHVEELLELEMRKQIDSNLQSGLIQLTGDGHFKYSFKGLFHLWKQILKDMFRLC